MSTSETLTDHESIRSWVEARGGRPSRVKGTGSKDEAGLLRIDFGEPEEGLEEVAWEAFFESFEESHLALLVSPEAQSRFNKFVRRER
mgnify:CR=1 FL=1|jgi:hypothetical protein